MAQSGESDLLDFSFDTPAPAAPSTSPAACQVATQPAPAAPVADVSLGSAVAPSPAAVSASVDLAEVLEAVIHVPAAVPGSSAALAVGGALLTPPAAAVPSAAPAPAGGPTVADVFGDDDWEAFQSAVPAGAAAVASSTVAHADAIPSSVVAVSVADPLSLHSSTAAAAGVAPATLPVASVSAAAEVGSFDPLVSPSNKVQDPFSSLETLEKQRPSDNLISFSALDEFDPVAQTWAKDTAPGHGAKQEAISPPAASSSSASPAVASAAAPSHQAAASSSGADGDLLGLGGSAQASRQGGGGGLLGDDGDDVEDVQKITIYVYHKGEKNVVSWYSDMAPVDIKEAVLCACDAIIDGGFVLREVQFTGDDETTAEPKEDGRIYQFEDFDQLDGGQTYIIESSKERDDLKKFTGDRWRRLRVQIDPLLHVEANKAIERMRRGSNLLKHTHYGFPHLRQFQLSDDRKRLVWYSGAKRKEDSVVNLDEVQEIRLGQTTPVFLHYRLPMLEHLSFSLVYGPKGTKTLDLTCKDEFEFDHWVTGLKAIFYHFKNRQISKEALLGHSKRFRKALEKNNVGIKLTKLPEVKEKGHVGLDDCIEIVTHTPQQLDTKMERLKERLKTMSQQVARLDHHAAAEMEVDLSLLTGQGPAYASVFVQDEDAQDEEMEIRRMHELVNQTTEILQQARNELIALNQRSRPDAPDAAGAGSEANKGKKKENAACKHIDQLLWKAEVDLENVEDMYLRHIDNQRDTATPFSVGLADMNQRLSRAASDIEESLSRKIDELRSWFR